MNKDQKDEAIQQMITHCDYATGAVSARGVLYELGYHSEADEVLKYIFDRGFTYCLDPDFHLSNMNTPEPISAGVCHWDPEQLKSRLRSL
jgi:hypothetical protein